MKCKWHLCQNSLSGRQTAFCSRACGNKFAVTKRRRLNKIELMQTAGMKCVDCEYQGPPFMFDFDHRVPTDKSFGLGAGGLTKSIASLIDEASKCDLVCARCHRMRTHLQRCSGCEYCNN